MCKIIFSILLIASLSVTQSYAIYDADCQQIKVQKSNALSSNNGQLSWYDSLFNKQDTCVSMYYQMPKLFAYDDFDECMGIYANDAVYCVSNVKIETNTSSELYNYIVEYSKNRKQHFRHDKLKRGLCVNKCRKMIDSESNDNNKVISDCVNNELIDNYGLKGTSIIDYCLTSNDQIPLDSYDVIVIVMIVILITIVIISSLYDRYLRNTLHYDSKASVHYQSELKTSKNDQWLTLFSMRRNWRILSSPSKTEFSDLKMFQSMRTFTFLCVIIGHCYTLAVAIPSHNPIYIENFHKELKSMFLLNGNIVVQTFFYMSGFLSAYLFMFYREKERSSNLAFFTKAVVFRYIRLVPVLLFMITLHATWLNKLGDGPFWYQFVNFERQVCRDNWWINLIFLNNYIKTGEMCMLQTWYISADFWLSILANVCLIIIVKYPTLRNWILSSIIGFSMVITAYVTYAYEFEPITIFSSELIRNGFKVIDPTDKEDHEYFYLPTHMNLGNYFIGIATGLWYKNIKNSNVNYRKNKLLKVVGYSCLIIGFLTILSGYVFYSFDFEKPSIWIALVAVGMRHIWGVLLAIGTIAIIYHHGWFTRDLLNYDGFKIFGRISYSAFVCHVFVLKIMMMRTHQMTELSIQNILMITIACFVVSNFFALFLTLWIEIPVSSALKIITSERGKSMEELQKKNTENDNML